jgi:hypothetical protein
VITLQGRGPLGYIRKVESVKISARHLKVGDLMRVDGEGGWWTVDAMFFEGPEVIDLDLVRAGDFAQYGAPFQYSWHVSSDHQVQRADVRSA